MPVGMTNLRVVRRARGASVVEYALLVVAIGLGVCVGIKALGGNAAHATGVARCMFEQGAANGEATGCSHAAEGDRAQGRMEQRGPVARAER